MAGMKVVVVKCLKDGDIDVSDLKAKALKYKDELSAIMVTYPSTHGVFEETIKEVCQIVHDHGGMVYMDGANFNAQVGLCQPGAFGADVLHLNLHKTFCIPHGGGGPGVGPIAVVESLKPFLPSREMNMVSAAEYGSAMILPISWMYIRMMGLEGLTKASQVAIASANYIAKKLSPAYDVLYTDKNGYVAHECIIDVRRFKKEAGVDVGDIARRLMDYGFHAPTMSWPVAGTLMIEPTESESLEELDRFCDAMLAIKQEISSISDGDLPKDNNPLVHAPHTAAVLVEDSWDKPYSRSQAVFPKPWVESNKFWPTVGKVDNAYGDRNLVCSCPPLEDYS